MRGGSGEEPVPQDEGNWVSLVGILMWSGLGSLASLDKPPPHPKKQENVPNRKRLQRPQCLLAAWCQVVANLHEPYVHTSPHHGFPIGLRPTINRGLPISTSSCIVVVH